MLCMRQALPCPVAEYVGWQYISPNGFTEVVASIWRHWPIWNNVARLLNEPEEVE